MVLFGSEVRGEAWPDSDIDLLVLLDWVADYGDELQRYLTALYPLAHQLDRPIPSPWPPRNSRPTIVPCTGGCIKKGSRDDAINQTLRSSRHERQEPRPETGSLNQVVNSQ